MKWITWCALEFKALCHNPIFTHEIFSGVGIQNEAARTKPAWSDEGSSHQITSKRGLGHISQNLTKFDQGWPSLTGVDQVWPRFDRNRFWPEWGPLHPKTLKTRSGIHFPEFGEFWPELTKFDWSWPSLTQVWPNRRPDRRLNQTDLSLTIV